MAEFNPLPKITEQRCGCTCGWKGTVGDTEPDDDGELTCPKCGKIIVVTTQAPERGGMN
jgi:hypothetical protein